MRELMNPEIQYTTPFLTACHECDLLQQIAPLPPGGAARCSRCGAELHRHKKNSVERTLALAVTGIILFVVANVYPFLGFRISGRIRHSNLITGVVELYHQELWMLAILVFIMTILVPALQLIGMFYILLPLKFKLRLPGQMLVFRYVRYFQPWGMMEVFLLGMLVSVIKLAKMATIIPGTAVYAFMALIFILASMSAFFDPHLVWEHGAWKNREQQP